VAVGNATPHHIDESGNFLAKGNVAKTTAITPNHAPLIG
jgi:hypothetical protein